MVNSVAPTTLSRRLYTDHLEEVAFLLALRTGIFHDPDVPWPRVDEYEQRLLAHRDALIEGAEAATALATELLTSEDIDNVRAAAYILAGHKTGDQLAPVWQMLAQASAEGINAVGYALRYPENRGVGRGLEPLLSHERPEVRAMAVEVLGYRREITSPQVEAALADQDAEVARQAAMASRRMHETSLVRVLQIALGKQPATAGIEVALALMTLGASSGLDWLRQYCRSLQTDYGPAPLYLGLAGESNSVPPSEASVCGLGVAGRVDSSETTDCLLRLLTHDDESIRVAAAGALELMYASGMTEEHTQQQEWTDADGEVIDSETVTLVQPSTSPQEWSAWLGKNASRFQNATRARRGRPWSLGGLFEELNDPMARYERRSHAAWEVIINEGPFRHFEADWFTIKQQQVLTDWHQLTGSD